jgi:hypothetical protein
VGERSAARHSTSEGGLLRTFSGMFSLLYSLGLMEDGACAVEPTATAPAPVGRPRPRYPRAWETPITHRTDSTAMLARNHKALCSQRSGPVAVGGPAITTCRGRRAEAPTRTTSAFCDAARPRCQPGSGFGSVSMRTSSRASSHGALRVGWGAHSIAALGQVCEQCVQGLRRSLEVGCGGRVVLSDARVVARVDHCAQIHHHTVLRRHST